MIVSPAEAGHNDTTITILHNNNTIHNTIINYSNVNSNRAQISDDDQWVVFRSGLRGSAASSGLMVNLRKP